jgi:DNA replication protein DnaC
MNDHNDSGSVNGNRFHLALLDRRGSRECLACKKKFTFDEIVLDEAVMEGKPVRYSNESLWAEPVCSRRCLVAGMEEVRKKKAQEKERQRVKNINALLLKSGVPKTYLAFQLINFDKPITLAQKKLLQFVSRCSYPFAKPILVTGPAGTGKTHLAVALLREILLKGYCENPLFITGVELMSQLRQSNSSDSDISPEDIISRFTQNRFVIFDDIGVEKITEYVQQSWYQIIDIRFSRGLSTLYTSNLTQVQCEEKFGPRITSRLFGGKVFEIDGEDVRIAMGERECG